MQQAHLGQFAIGDVRYKTLDQTVFVRLEQEVHDHIDSGAVLAPQTGVVTEQALLGLQGVANLLELGFTTDEQMMREIGQVPERLGRVFVAEHPCQGWIGCTDTFLQACLENAVHSMFEQPFVAVALGLEFFKTGHELRVMALTGRMCTQPKEPGERIVLFRVLRHRPLQRLVGSTNEGWSECRGPA